MAMLTLMRNKFRSLQATPHGFRATARTMLAEIFEIRTDFLEHQLAHSVRDATGEAYNRTSFIKQRREILQKWADYLDDLVEAHDAKAVARN